MINRLTLWFYGVLMTALQPMLRRKLAQRGRAEPGYLDNVDERFGRYSVDQAKGGAREWIWIHAVSLGETRAAAALIKAMRVQLPGMRLLLTHGTATGRAEGQALLREGDVQVWQPWDAPAAVDRFLSCFQPRLGVLLETEVWPVLTAHCQAQDVPLVLVNARLSEKSLKNARRLSWLARPAYAALTAVYAQTRADAASLQKIGADVQGVFGNLKFDANPDPILLQQGQDWLQCWRAQQLPAKPVVLFASSREGEELLFLNALCQLAETQRESVQWLIVPRHPQRFDEVAALVVSVGLSVSRRSQWTELGPPVGVLPSIWLGDSLGEMPSYFSLSALALLGGSFLPFGGQNLIEAAACGCPVVMGPHTFNFAEAAQSSADTGAALRVADMDSAIRTGLTMLGNSESMNQSKQAATSFLLKHRGAVDRTVKALMTHVQA